MIRVVIVDDDPLVLAGLRMILGGSNDITIAGEATDGHAAISTIAREKPDVVLLDIRMPRMDGISVLRRLPERGISARVIVLTTFDTDELILTALKQGAAGYLLKDTSPGDIVNAVRRVAAGEPALSPTVTTQLIAAATKSTDDSRRRAARHLIARLTDRERDVAIAVSQGLTNPEIAQTLHMGIATVKTHVGSVFAKLEVTNRVQVARYVHDAGISAPSG
ncbi:response regulator [Catelliglobosispora koreensis]|uniref:response regulator n=1 Tax=Catelliglobosispora koreensis TaxID=129052 RepID=UPI0009FCA679|nr:response regulator transcription factor [Catelliglobosispora koreensis]